MMPTYTDFPHKFGKRKATYHPNVARYTAYRNASGFPVRVPDIFGHGNSFKDWGMLGNDQYGDCVFAGSDHEVMLLDNLASEGAKTGYEAVKFTAANTLADYGAVTGFNPETGENDNGTNVVEALDYRVKTGLIDAEGKRHKIAAYVALEPGNIEHLVEAIFIFEAVGIGFEVPASAEEQFGKNEVWSVVPGNPEIVGGHYVPLVGKPAVGNLAAVTWGRRQVMTEEFYKKYCDEAYAYITEEELNKRTKKNWGGFDWATLQADLQLVK
jgi:hypothetical protein